MPKIRTLRVGKDFAAVDWPGTVRVKKVTGQRATLEIEADSETLDSLEVRIQLDIALHLARIELRRVCAMRRQRGQKLAEDLDGLKEMLRTIQPLIKKRFPPAAVSA